MHILILHWLIYDCKVQCTAVLFSKICLGMVHNCSVENCVVAKFSVLQYSSSKSIGMVQNCLVQYVIQRGATTKCSTAQWEWMQLHIVHRKASHCPKLVNWAKLGPDKILDSSFCLIWSYFYADFRYAFLDSCWKRHFVRFFSSVFVEIDLNCPNKIRFSS